jgi:hypothetical protein
VPLRFCEQLYVLSLHRAVAVPQDAEMGDAAVHWFDPGGGDGTGVGVGGVGAGVGVGVGVGVNAGDGLGLAVVGRAMMVMWTVPATPKYVARMSASPAPTPVTVPNADALATNTFEDCQAASVVTF